MSSPSKGKAKDDSGARWDSGWWEFYSFAEQFQRPVVWTNSSTIITSHPMQPILVSRLFSSSKEYAIVSPEPVISSPSAYEPAKVITISPDNKWLFAYFPGLERDGIGCLWNRGYPVDSWSIKHWWSFSRGAGVVAASWAGYEREWIMDTDGPITRLPPRGPLTPVSNPTLLVVTQEQRLNVYYLRDYDSNLKLLSCSLVRPDSANENQGSNLSETATTTKGCVSAAIGQCYGPEFSLVVAMRFEPDRRMDSGTDDPELAFLGPRQDTEAIGENHAIDLCEVKLSFDGTILSLKSNPIPPIHHAARRVTRLAFVLPSPTRKGHPEKPSKQSPRKDGHLRANSSAENTMIYLAIGSLDAGEYTEAPRSEVALYVLTRQPSSSSNVTWSIHSTSRSFSPSILSFFSPVVTTTAPIKAVIYVGLLDASGPIPNTKPKPKFTPVGKIIALQLPNLSDDTTYENSSILSAIGRANSDLPLSIDISPNTTLLCAVSGILPTRTVFHRLPRRHTINSTSDATGSRPHGYLKSRYAFPLVAALLSRKSTADISYLLSNPVVNAADVVDTLYGALCLFDTNVPGGLTASRISEVVGAAVEIYKTRASRCSNNNDREHFTELSQTAMEVCTLAACLTAFEDCQEENAYDLDVVWQLVSLSSWIVGLLERILRECLTLQGPFASPTQAPITLHLTHPFALSNLRDALHHINSFRAYLGTLTARGETAQLARDALLDLVDGSGLNLPELESMLSEALPPLSKNIKAEDMMRALASCQPVPAMLEPLETFINKLASSSTINKPRLFIKASDLVDEVSKLSRLSISDPSTKDKDRDVVTKGVLLRHGAGVTCLRCGGRSEVISEVNAAGNISRRWRAWEKMWLARCICGGSWISTTE